MLGRFTLEHKIGFATKMGNFHNKILKNLIKTMGIIKTLTSQKKCWIILISSWLSQTVRFFDYHMIRASLGFEKEREISIVFEDLSSNSVSFFFKVKPCNISYDMISALGKKTAHPSPPSPSTHFLGLVVRNKRGVKTKAREAETSAAVRVNIAWGK